MVRTLKKFFSKKYNRACFLLILVSSVSYAKAFLGYFQGDEWSYFAKSYTILSKPFGDLKLLFDIFLDPASHGAHFAPVLSPLSYVMLKLFGLNFVLYQFASLAVHVGIVYSLFYFAYLLSKKNLLFGFLAGLFFGLSAVHFHAVSWISAFGVQVALLFSLLSLIFLKRFYLEKNRKFRTYSLLFFVLAIFSKETSFFLLIVYPMVAFFSEKKDWKSRIKSLKTFWILTIAIFVIEAVFRAYTFLVNTVGGVKSPYTSAVFNSFDITLIYKTVTWSLKSITQTFFPAKIIYSMGEKITVLGFPYYAQEAEVHGTNFLIFAQSAGAEIFMYAASVPLILGIYKLYKYFTKRDQSISQAVAIGITIILFSVIPLIFIVNSLIAKFGYVSLFDSRHIYSMSLGGSLLFAGLFLILHKRLKIVFFPLLILWIIANLYLMNQTLSEYALMGYQRKAILNKVFATVPSLDEKAVFLIKSNSAYYGFGVMPPFQTNLGHILAVRYYQKKQLPIDFLKSELFSDRGIMAEGYFEEAGKGFGYFIQESKLLTDIINGSFKPRDIYAFFWDGTKNQVQDITFETKEKAYDQLNVFSEVEDWNVYTDEENKFSFRYPLEMELRELDTTNKRDMLKDIMIAPKSEEAQIEEEYDDEDLSLRVTLRSKPETLGIDAFASAFNDSDGNIIGSNFTFRNIKFLNGDSMTTVYALKGKHAKYFFQVNTHEKEFEIAAFGKKGERRFADGEERYSKDVERIISTFRF